jgi:Holliday junction resolvasome RuvABC endonuclease subunit
MILALDLATKTGWAFRQNGLIVSGVQDFSLRRGDSPGMRYVYFNAWLNQLWQKLNPQVIFYEQPHMRGGHATEVLAGLVAHLQALCARAEIEHTAVHTGTLKKFATGSGRGDKSGMIAKARKELMREPIDDNEADAVCLLLYAEENIEIRRQESIR